MSTKNKPITEMSNHDDILAAFRVMLEDARDNSNYHTERAEKYRYFLERSQYQTRLLDRWTYRPAKQSNRWMPRLEGPEMRQIIDELTPLLVRSRPGITIEPEDSRTAIDLREYGEGDALVGGYSELEPDLVAEAATEILEGMRKHQSRDILDKQIAEESLISGMSAVDFRVENDVHGTTLKPQLVEPGNLLLDPQCKSWWDLSDCQYTIRIQRLSSAQIKHYYGLDEGDYADTGESLEPTSTIFGRVQRYWNTVTGSSEYKMNFYDVYTLYYQPVLGISDIDAVDAPEAPPMEKFTFIGENYYLAKNRRVNPFWHKEFPYVLFQSAPQPFNQFGVSDVAKNMGTQIALNIARNMALATSMINASPPWIAEQNVAARWNFEPSGVTKLGKGKIDQIMQAPLRDTNSQHALWQALSQSLQESRIDPRELSQTSVRSGTHAAVVLNAVLSKHGLRVLMLDPSWRRLARFEMSNLQQFINPSINHYLQQKEFTEFAGLDDAIRNLRYDVDIASRDAMPSDPTELFNMMMILYQNGMIDLGEFYEQVKLDISPELKASIEEQSNPDDFIAGVPPAMQAEARGQAQQTVGDLTQSL